MPGRAGCWHRHEPDDPRLGEPLCAGCYDARAQVVWNALAPELWRYTTTYLDRALACLVGCSEGELRRLVRVSYAKVAEFQRRGAVYFHAVLRLDAATECRCPGCLAPPPEPFTAGLLERALRGTVASVRVPCPPLEDDGPPRFARWGAQLDMRNITRGDDAGELSAEQVAGYVAKYATKATESFGTGLDRRLGDGDLERLADVIDQRYCALVLVAAYGGLRVGELAGLRRGRVDLLRGTSRWPRSSPRSGACCGSGRPRPAPAAARSGCPGRWWTSWPPT
jgi:hypothetical protein